MRFLDLAEDRSIPVLLDMIRLLSRASDSRAVLTEFMARYSRVRPIDHFMGVAQCAEAGVHAEPAFRVLYDISADEVRSGRGAPMRDLRPDRLLRLPVQRGGFVSKMIKEPTPKMVLDLDLREDPVLAPLAGEIRSCMVLPIFEGDRVFEWSFSFSRTPDGFLPLHVAQGVMVANLLGLANRNIDALIEVRQLHGRLNQQLEQVAQLQQALLPRRLPRYPGFEFAASYLTSDQTGGDYYDFKQCSEAGWAGLIADVSGHGAAAATVMAMLRGIVHSYDDPDFGAGPSFAEDPTRFVRFVNRQLVEAGIDGAFVTAIFFEFDPVRATFRYANCGHPPPRIRRRDGSIDVIDAESTIPLGILAPIDIPSAEFTLQPGDALVFYTDGITEAFNESREMFGTARLDAAISASTGSPDQIVDSVHRALFAHRQAATRDDDQTILVIRAADRV